MEFIKSNDFIWIILAILPAIIFITLSRKAVLTRKRQKTVRAFGVYIATRQATNDVVEVVFNNILIAKNLILQARDIIKTLRMNKDQEVQRLDTAVNNFSIFTNSLARENKISIDRSYSKNLIQKISNHKTLSTFWFWLPMLLVLILISYYSLYISSNAIIDLVYYLVIIVEILIHFLALKALNKVNSLIINNQDQLTSIHDLFNIRRIFIEDNIKVIEQNTAELAKFLNYCHSIPQARSFVQGYELLKSSLNELILIKEVTLINLNTPLFSISAYLHKIIQEKYIPVAKNRNIELIDNVKPGLSSRITADNISRLVEPIIQDALENKNIEKNITIKISGMSRSIKNIITITNNGKKITEARLMQIYSYGSNADLEDEDQRLFMSLRINKLILSTIEGEIKVRTHKHDGLIIQIIIPRIDYINLINISPKISASSGPIK